MVIGTILGPYRVLEKLGAGGMGEVYRARDTKLDRDVAIKILPDSFAHDPERVARFTREAKTLAALNHPHIAQIHGLEEARGIRALVMELVEGPTLADRIAGVGAGGTKVPPLQENVRGAGLPGLPRQQSVGAGLSGLPIPLDEALAIAKQIAEALEAAHEHGIIHRDLKPANIKVKDDGTVKVLDFGLAKALDPAAGAAGAGAPGDSPTITSPAAMTGAGVILGTAAYMAPEQAKGHIVDKRADIWAFGCVLYEMLTGRRAFDGDDVFDTLTSVMKSDPDWKQLPAETPTRVVALVQRCLKKDARERLRDIGDARVEIDDVLAGPVQAPTTGATSVRRTSGERVAWVVACLLFVALIGSLALDLRSALQRAPADARPVRFEIVPPGPLMERVGGGSLAAAPVALSPDGQRVAVVTRGPTGRSLLWVRSLDTLIPQALTGTEGAIRPFWSPDSRFLAFFQGGKLKKIDTSGGPPTTLCDVPLDLDRGGTWGSSGLIVFGQAAGPLQKVSAAGGGVAVPVFALGLDERAWWPTFLPDGRHLLYGATTAGPEFSIYVASLDSPERTLLLQASSSNVVYSRGHILFLRDTTLMAQPFDVRRLALTGEAFPVAEQVQIQGSPNTIGVFSASEGGLIAYQSGAPAGSRLMWFDRSGKEVGELGDEANYSHVQLSPDGTRAAVSITVRGENSRDVWLYDVARGLRTRFTFDPADDSYPTWSPDGSRIVFNSSRKTAADLYEKTSSGAGAEETFFADGMNKYPMSWSPDGRFLLYVTGGGAGAATQTNDLWALPLFGDRKPCPFISSRFSESGGLFSPDGRWVVYQSNESGRTEVYVTSFPGRNGPWMISKAGGERPRWRRDGREIFYLDPENKLMAAAVATTQAGGFEVREVRSLFETRRTGTGFPYDVSADGQRFLVNSLSPSTEVPPFTVVLNWTAGLRK